MAKTSDDKTGATVAPDLQKIAPVVEVARVFRDTVFTSRTLILPDGSPLPVAKGRVTAVTDEHFQYLRTNPEFVALTE